MNKQVTPLLPLNRITQMRYFNYIINRFVKTLIKTSNGSVNVDTRIFFQNDVFIRFVVDQQLTVEQVIHLPQFSLEVIKVILEYLHKGDSRYYKKIETEVKRAIKFFEPMQTDFDILCYKTDNVKKKKNVLQNESVSQSVSSKLKNNTKPKQIQHTREILKTRTEPVNKVTQDSSIIILSDSDESVSPVKNVQTTQRSKSTDGANKKRDVPEKESRNRSSQSVSSSLKNNTKPKPIQNISKITTQPVNLKNRKKHNTDDVKKKKDVPQNVYISQSCQSVSSKLKNNTKPKLIQHTSEISNTRTEPVNKVTQDSSIIILSDSDESVSPVKNVQTTQRSKSTDGANKKRDVPEKESRNRSSQSVSSSLKNNTKPKIIQNISVITTHPVNLENPKKLNKKRSREDCDDDFVIRKRFHNKYKQKIPKKRTSASSESSPEFCSTILPVSSRQTEVSSSVSSLELFETALSDQNATKLPTTHSESSESSLDFCSTMLPVSSRQTEVSSLELFETALSDQNATKLPTTHSESSESSLDFCSTMLPVSSRQTEVESSSELFETALGEQSATKLPTTHSESPESSLDFCSTMLPVSSRPTEVASSVSPSELFETPLSGQNATKLSTANYISPESSPDFFSTMLPISSRQTNVVLASTIPSLSSQVFDTHLSEQNVTTLPTAHSISPDSSPEFCSMMLSDLKQQTNVVSSSELFETAVSTQNAVVLPEKLSTAHSICPESSLEFCSTILPVTNQQIQTLSSSQLCDTAINEQNAVALLAKMRISPESSPEFCSPIMPTSVTEFFQATPREQNVFLLHAEIPTSSVKLLKTASGEQNNILLPVKVPSSKLLKIASSEQNSVVPMTSSKSLTSIKSTSNILPPQIPTSSKVFDKEKPASTNDLFYFHYTKRVFWWRTGIDNTDDDDLSVIRTNSYYLHRDRVKTRKLKKQKLKNKKPD